MVTLWHLPCNALCCQGWLPSPKLYWLSFYAARKGFSPKRICQDTQLRLQTVTSILLVSFYLPTIPFPRVVVKKARQKRIPMSFEFIFARKLIWKKRRHDINLRWLKVQILNWPFHVYQKGIGQWIPQSAKCQLISKCPFGVIVWTKIPTKIFSGFLP